MLIRTKFLGATDTLGARIAVQPVDPRRGYRFVFPYDYAAHCAHAVAAEKWWSRMRSEHPHGEDMEVSMADSYPQGYYFLISAPI